MRILISEVKGHEGECKPTWLNTNSFWNRFDGGISGFFKNVKQISFLFLKFRITCGEEFHGIINRNNRVVSTIQNEY